MFPIRLTRFCRAQIGAGLDYRHFRWGKLNVGIRFSLPSLRLRLIILSRCGWKGLRKRLLMYNISFICEHILLIKDLLRLTSLRTWRRWTGGQVKMWTFTIKADLSKPRVFGHTRWRKDWAKDSSELAQDRRAWSASVRDVVNAICDAGSTRPGWMPTQVQVKYASSKLSLPSLSNSIPVHEDQQAFLNLAHLSGFFFP